MKLLRVCESVNSAHRLELVSYDNDNFVVLYYQNGNKVADALSYGLTHAHSLFDEYKRGGAQFMQIEWKDEENGES